MKDKKFDNVARQCSDINKTASVNPPHMRDLCLHHYFPAVGKIVVKCNIKPHNKSSLMIPDPTTEYT